MSATASAGSRPLSSTGPSMTVNSGESFSPREASIRARWAATVSTASGGVRSSTIATAAERSAAWRRKSHGTWSAYRAAEVTKIQRSAAASSCAASVRLLLLDRVDVGGVEDGQPLGHDVERRRAGGPTGRGSARWTRSSSGSSRSWPNHPPSAGLCTSTGERVVGPQHARLGHPACRRAS